MKKHEIKIGETYRVRLHGKDTQVRVNAVKDNYHNYPSRRWSTRYTCTNLATGREVEIKSAAKFRSRVGDGRVSDTFGPRGLKRATETGV